MKSSVAKSIAVLSAFFMVSFCLLVSLVRLVLICLLFHDDHIPCTLDYYV